MATRIGSYGRMVPGVRYFGFPCGRFRFTNSRDGHRRDLQGNKILCRSLLLLRCGIGDLFLSPALLPLEFYTRQ